jgi:hypothetical protein
MHITIANSSKSWTLSQPYSLTTLILSSHLRIQNSLAFSSKTCRGFASELYRPSDRRLSAKIVPTFADRECHVVNVTDAYGRIPVLAFTSTYWNVLCIFHLIHTFYTTNPWTVIVLLIRLLASYYAQPSVTSPCMDEFEENIFPPTANIDNTATFYNQGHTTITNDCNFFPSGCFPLCYKMKMTSASGKKLKRFWCHSEES